MNKPDAIHVIQTLAITLAAGLPSLATALPGAATPYLLAGGAICSLVGSTLAALSNTLKTDGAQ